MKFQTFEPQVLYFTPTFRSAVFRHRPEPGAEFSLACEFRFLFTMLASCPGVPCQASAVSPITALHAHVVACAANVLRRAVHNL